MLEEKTLKEIETRIRDYQDKEIIKTKKIQSSQNSFSKMLKSPFNEQKYYLK